MRKVFLHAVLGILLGFIAPTVLARDPFPPINTKPGDFKEIFRIIYAKDPDTGEDLDEDADDDTIPPYLEEAMCGGYIADETIGEQLGGSGKVAKVTGLPGREGEPLGDLRSGMAKRIETGGTQSDGFLYPEDAKGLGTTCVSGQAKTTKFIWDEGQRKRVTKEFGYPYFQDPPCLWRLKNEGMNKLDPPVLTPDDFEELKGPDEDGNERRLPHTPGNCSNLCTWFNEWQYNDCIETVVGYEQQDEASAFIRTCGTAYDPIYDADGALTGWNTLTGRYGQRYICSDHEVLGAPSCSPGAVDPPAEWPNSTGCAGDECRCNGPHCVVTPPAPDLSFSSDLPYATYFRSYVGSYERGSIAAEEEENEEGGGQNGDRNSVSDIPVACYGFYQEFDPKERQTYTEDRRCIINIDVEEYKNTQKQREEYGQYSSEDDVDPLDPQNFRAEGEDLVKDEGEDEKVEFDAWYEKLGTAFSLLNEKPLDKVYEKDLTNVYLDTEHLDTAVQRAIFQAADADMLAQSNLIRAFDDTGPERSIVSWWQKQETEASELVRRPVIRLLLPSGWAFGADPKDPLFAGVESSSNSSKKPSELDRVQRIELQIDADEDLLGQALAYIERSLLLRIEEEPVPLIIFMESPQALRAKGQKACADYLNKNQSVTSCENAPDNVKKYMEKLEDYAEHMEQVRELRLELAKYAGEVLDLQGQVTSPISSWIGENLEQYKQIIAEQRAIAEQALPSWMFAQNAMNQFNNVTNLPWCMHQGKTTATYSLLDPWLPARVESGSADEAGSGPDYSLPDLTTLDIPPSQDLIVDFSALSAIRDPIVLPVLKPIQIRLNIPPLTDDFDPEDLPDLPPMQPIKDLMAGLQFPTVAPPPPPPETQIPEPLGAGKIAEIGSMMDNIAFLVLNMNRTYKDFWESIGPLKPEDEWEESEREDFEKQRKRKTNLECFDWEEQPCMHVEMDLLERMTRIASRPLVMLKEDFESIGTPRLSPNACLPYDEACLRLHRESIPKKNQWEVMGPSEPLNDLETLKEDLRELTFPEDIGEVEWEDLPMYNIDLHELMPSTDVPRPIDFLPPAPPPSDPSS